MVENFRSRSKIGLDLGLVLVLDGGHCNGAPKFDFE